MMHGHGDSGSPAWRGMLPDHLLKPVKDFRKTRRVRAGPGKEDAHEVQDTGSGLEADCVEETLDLYAPQG